MTTTPAPEELLPCPFCRKPMREVTDETGHYWVHPGETPIDCWLGDAAIADSPEEIAAWNRRVSTPQPPAVTDEMVERFCARYYRGIWEVDGSPEEHTRIEVRKALTAALSSTPEGEQK